MMRVNVHSVYLVTQACLPLLLMARGSIVNIGSVAGLVGVKKRFAYCASKGAVIAMTRQIAVDYPKELRVNCIAPGTVQSPFVEGYLEKYHAHEKEEDARGAGGAPADGTAGHSGGHCWDWCAICAQGSGVYRARW